jgi:hypothetical protein
LFKGIGSRETLLAKNLPVWGGSKLMGGMDGIILKFKVSHRIA